MFRRKRIGLALGAGGARGIAHIGILRVFEEESIPLDLIVGTSIGALIGGAFASGIGTHELESRLDDFLDSPVYQSSTLKSIRAMIDADKKLSLTQKVQAFLKNRILLAQAMFKQGILDTEDFQSMIDFFLPDIEIEDTQIPFRAVATDLVSGEPVVFSEGSLRRAVLASSAVPGAVPPIISDGMILSDGAITHTVPAEIVRKAGARFVISVSVNRDISTNENISSAMDVYVRSTSIGSFYLEQHTLQHSDVVIHPKVDDLHWTDFEGGRSLVAEGEKAAREKLSQIKKGLPLLKRLWPVKRDPHTLEESPHSSSDKPTM